MSEQQAPTEADVEPPPPQGPADPRPPLHLLSWFERLAFRMASFTNGSAYRVMLVWQAFVLFPLLWIFMGRRLLVRGEERLKGLPPDASFLLIANHRSFFDLFVLNWIFVGRRGLRHRVSFPVRSNFFYENPVGLFFNLFFSGGSMFPPIFRSGEKRAFNQHAVRIMLERLKAPKNMIGFHPEGTRGKGPDPYELLRAQPGAGKLVLEARPLVVPAFVSGLSNSLWKELVANLKGGRPAVVIFGEPLTPDRWPEGSRLTLQLKVAEQLLDAIRALQPEEKALRAELAEAAKKKEAGTR